MTAPENRSDWKWIENTYWYCPAVCMPSIQAQRDNTFTWNMDQTVWHITGYKDGYFWGVASALLTAFGEAPDAGNKSDMTFFASITPEGRVYVTFIQSSVSNTIGTGCMTRYQGEPSFEMQMSSGPSAALVVHWAYMMQVKPGDPEWEHLPGAGVSVEEMVGNIAPPVPESVKS